MHVQLANLVKFGSFDAMDAILSSFCFTQSAADGSGFYHRLPPVCFESWDRFVPDYAALFLFDRFYLDAAALTRIRHDPHFKAHAQMVEALESCGRLEVRDFAGEIAPYRPVVESAVEQRIADLGQWHKPFEHVVALWEPFADQLADNYYGDWEDTALSGRRWGEDENDWPPERRALGQITFPMHYGLNYQLLYTLDLIRARKACEDYYREKAKGVVRAYLEHVLTTMCLADHLGASVHDWEDIRPVYQRVLTDAVGIGSLRRLREQQQMRQLIKIMFPRFRPKSPEALARALDDRRIESLRTLVARSVEDGDEFDTEFANQVLREVVATERDISRFRNVVGWASKPLSVIPWLGSVADTAASAVAETIYAKRKRRKKSWFYLLSEIDCGR